MSNQRPETESTQQQTSSSVVASATNSRATPGPWRTDRKLTDDSGESVAIIASDGQYVGCADAVLEGHFDAKLNTANAKLMAASPVMLEALKELVDFFKAVPSCTCTDCDEVAEKLDIATAAIEAATGEGELVGVGHLQIELDA